MGARRSSAKPVRLVCDKCGYPFTVVAFISKGVDKDAWLKDSSANSHDCEDAAKHRVRSMGVERVGQQKQKGKK
ncbi:MAG TPA: hypothetical protein PLF26_10725 [Blastocatellia bacterium]|nr:hypothetical protein [Blastocatellia bacterium]